MRIRSLTIFTTSFYCYAIATHISPGSVSPRQAQTWPVSSLDFEHFTTVVAANFFPALFSFRKAKVTAELPSTRVLHS